MHTAPQENGSSRGGDADAGRPPRNVPVQPTILHISGPPASGKTTLAELLAARAQGTKPDYLRFDLGTDTAPRTLRIADSLSDMASVTHQTVQSELVFEEIADALKTITANSDGKTIFVETNAQPCFRHAYPYHVKVFVMLPPPTLGVIFRSEAETAEAIQRAMDDTAEFASELFGMGAGPQDSTMLPNVKLPDARSQPAQSVEEFLNSDVGTEIAARMQLQPEYHAIMDSDVILLNVGLCHDEAVTARCARRIDALLETLRQRLGRQHWFVACNPFDGDDPRCRRGLERIELLMNTAKANPS